MPNIVYPKAKLRLLSPAFRPSRKLTAFNRVNLHVTASMANSQFGYFNSAGRASSHLHLDFDGNWEQYQYLDLQSEADLEGNDATISVETQGTGDGSWTQKQLAALAEFFAWCVKHPEIRIANRLATSSRINSDESKGLSWHRLGIDGNFPGGLQGGRLQRIAPGVPSSQYMHYSGARGKVCPGNHRVMQIPSIFAEAQKIIFPEQVTTSPPEVPEMAGGLAFAKFKGKFYVGDGLVRREINSTQLNSIRIRVTDGTFGGDPEIKEVSYISWLGDDLGNSTDIAAQAGLIAQSVIKELNLQTTLSEEDIQAVADKVAEEFSERLK